MVVFLPMTQTFNKWISRAIIVVHVLRFFCSGLPCCLGCSCHDPFASTHLVPQCFLLCLKSGCFLSDLVGAFFFFLSSPEKASFASPEIQVFPVTSLIVYFFHCPRERQDSVYNALQKVDLQASLVCIHDAARPLVTKACVRKVIFCN